MKRLFVIPLLFLYLLTASGIMVQLHYCGTQIESWAINSESKGCKDDPCDEKKEQNHDCCKDKIIKAKIAADQTISYPLKFFFSEKTVLPVLLFSLHDREVIMETIFKTGYRHGNSPPGNWQQIPLYKLHSSFTYYS